MIKPCIKCGVVDRYKNGGCRPCYKIAAAIYRKANPEKVKIATNIWRKANPEKARIAAAKYRKANSEKVRLSNANRRKASPEKIRLSTAKYRKANSEKLKISMAKWQKANPEKLRIRNQNRRARKKNNGGKLSANLAKTLYERQRGKCACCKSSLGKDYHLDHIMPLALGGKNEDWNMQLLKASCNMQKGAKDPYMWAVAHGRLI